jgi:hypothetical protein
MTVALELNIDAMPYPPLCDGQFLLRPGQAAKFLGVSKDMFNSLRTEIVVVHLPGCAHPRFRVIDLVNFVNKYTVETTEKMRTANRKAIEVGVLKIIEREKAKIKNMPRSRPVKAKGEKSENTNQGN